MQNTITHPDPPLHTRYRLQDVSKLSAHISNLSLIFLILYHNSGQTGFSQLVLTSDSDNVERGCYHRQDSKRDTH